MLGGILGPGDVPSWDAPGGRLHVDGVVILAILLAFIVFARETKGP
jgi:hypothetical protein